VEKVFAIIELAADQQTKAAGELLDRGKGAVRSAFRLVEAAVGGLDPAGAVEHAGGERADVAGEPFAGEGRYEIEVRAGPLRAAFDHDDEPADALEAILIGEPGDLRVHRLLDLLRDQPVGGPGEIAEH